VTTGRNSCAIALGSSVGDRAATIASAIIAIALLPRSRLVARSTAIHTAPVARDGTVRSDAPRSEYFLNAAVVIESTLSARDLLDHLMRIEREHGRDRARETPYGPRTLDLDLLTFGDKQVDEPGLVVPHPRMHERLFVLVPLAEIAPELRIPGLDACVAELKQRLVSAGARTSMEIQS
jgi:2-amino-4-hydroxy-6-hydroxymethyldihydropteridine diphosphokinase